jgi:hypothetical protein
MKIQPIVEGHGEVDAVPVLLRRLIEEAAFPDITILRTIRQHRSDLVRQLSLDRAIQLARTKDPDAILVLLDGDDDPCPGELATQLNQWAKASAHPIPCEVVIAHREFEAWFLASMESLRGKRGISDHAESHPKPEEPRDAKGKVTQQMVEGRSYVETADQVALTSAFEMQSAYRSCRSFRKMVKVFGILVAACGIGLPPWPPANWDAILQ